MLKPRSERIAKIVKSYPSKIKVLKIIQEESILVTVTNLVDALKTCDNKIALTNEALHKLADIFLHKARLAVVKATKDNHLIHTRKIILKLKLPLTKSNLETRLNILDTQDNNIHNNLPLPNIIELEIRVKTRSFYTKIILKKNYQSILRLELKGAINTIHIMDKENLNSSAMQEQKLLCCNIKKTSMQFSSQLSSVLSSRPARHAKGCATSGTMRKAAAQTPLWSSFHGFFTS